MPPPTAGPENRSTCGTTTGVVAVVVIGATVSAPADVDVLDAVVAVATVVGDATVVAGRAWPVVGPAAAVGSPALTRDLAEPHAASTAPKPAAKKARRLGTTARYRALRGRARHEPVFLRRHFAGEHESTGSSPLRAAATFSDVGSAEVRDGQPILAFAEQRAWEAWLEANHARASGVWAKLAKKSSGIASVQYPEVLDTALCFGWIDGQRVSLDATHYLQRFCPRTPKSPWSQINAAKVDVLVAAGRMRPAGRVAIDQAKADGRWARAYEPVSRATVPHDLRLALDASPAAAAFFAKLDSRNRYAVLYRLQEAKRAETRAKRLEQFVAMLARGEKFH